MPTSPPPYRAPRLHGLADGLVAPKHYLAMGDAVWVFLWAITRQTSPDGTVLNGRSIPASEIAADLGCCPRTARRHLATLSAARYLTLIRGNRGVAIKLMKNKKFRRPAQLPERTQPVTLNNKTDNENVVENVKPIMSGLYRPSEWTQTVYQRQLMSTVKLLSKDRREGPTETITIGYPYRDFMGNLHVKSKADSDSTPNPHNLPIVIDEENHL